MPDHERQINCIRAKTRRTPFSSILDDEQRAIEELESQLSEGRSIYEKITIRKGIVAAPLGDTGSFTVVKIRLTRIAMEEVPSILQKFENLEKLILWKNK